MKRLTPDERRAHAAEVTARERREQGLPRYIEDPLVLDLMASALEDVELEEAS